MSGESIPLLATNEDADDGNYRSTSYESIPGLWSSEMLVDNPPRRRRSSSDYDMGENTDLALSAAMKRSNSDRSIDYVTSLVHLQKARETYLRQKIGKTLRARSVLENLQDLTTDDIDVSETNMIELQEDCAFLKKALEIRNETEEFVDVHLERQMTVEVRLHQASYVVPVDNQSRLIETVIPRRVCDAYNSWKSRRQRTVPLDTEQPRFVHKYLLKDINLVLRPGRSYLVLGPPGSGKTLLLKMIASRLPGLKARTKYAHLQGRVEYNGLTMRKDQDLLLSKAVAFVDQNDQHEPRLTVSETFEFAYQCNGGTHRTPFMVKDSRELDKIIEKLDEENARVRLTVDGFGLRHVENTYVGNTDVQGVSGGQRRRVTVGEMMMHWCPVLCGDEISTGLDAASTYQIVRILSRLARVTRMTQVVSLKQPSPETVALFDEVVLLAKGQIIFTGPVPDAFTYFESIGFERAHHMDGADFLLALSTEDRKDFYWPDRPCPDAKQLCKIFQNSPYGESIREKLEEPLAMDWSLRLGKLEVDEESFIYNYNGAANVDYYRKRYAISFWRATSLNFWRHFTIWRRDVRFVRANFIKNVVMGVSVGMVFYKTKIVESIFGVMFQCTLFIMLGASTAAPSQIDDRSVFYKHADHNFFPALSFVVGRTLALIPQAISDTMTFGTIIYLLVGLESSVSSYLIFFSTLVLFSLTMSTMFSVFTSIAHTKGMVQVLTAVAIFLNMYFCGFLVPPEIIPPYYVWLYWWNPLSWVYRALLINEYFGPSYSLPVPGTDFTEGEWIFLSKGMVFEGKLFRKEWIAYCFVYLCPFIVVMVLLSGFGLAYFRLETGGQSFGEQITEERTVDRDVGKQESKFDVHFTPVHLTFEGISYGVRGSKWYDMLRILNNVDGYLQPGRLCAIMSLLCFDALLDQGSSGAGKTTLMDIIALRKQTGIISGEVRLNGHLQEAVSFRRCSGYVEQFDVQSPQLTVRETIHFSAKMRLDHNDSIMNSKTWKEKYVDHIIDMMELGPEAMLLVGDSETGGLSFEQRKRLSIAVELAASPSVLFLDEPTSGLDSRAAQLVVKLLKKIAGTGRTVCATIHQPSSSVFGLFDDLLLLKKGGKVVYFGDLGPDSNKLVDFFESRGANRINRGENPATWMLSAITEESHGTNNVAIDYAKLFENSDEKKSLKRSIATIKANAKDENKICFQNEFALSYIGRNAEMRQRLKTIYWRSPAYNRARLVLSLVLAFLISSVFVTHRNPDIMTETYISGVFSTIFISFIITGIMAITTVLPVMLTVRDVFYRHRAAGMLDHWSLSWSLASAEKGFILLSSTMYCAVFYFTIGLDLSFKKFVAFWGFFTFSLAINSYFGQAFMCMFKGIGTAGILCSVVIGMNNFFSGLIVRPQYLQGFWQAPYWLTPGRYVYEGLIAPQFYDDYRTVIASRGSEFHNFLNCTDTQAISGECKGTVAQYMDVFFGFKFHETHIALNAGVLGLFLVLARVSTHIALSKFNHTSSG